jgi:hypothetical protein
VRENGTARENQVVYARPKTLIPPKTIEVGVRKPDVVVRAPRVF